MPTTRRAALVLSVATALAHWAAPAGAQAAFPNKPVKLHVGFPAGGPLDAHARLLADRLSQFVVAKLAAAFKATLVTPDIRSGMVSQGADPAYLGPEDFTRDLGAEMPKQAKAVKDSGARLD